MKRLRRKAKNGRGRQLMRPLYDISSMSLKSSSSFLAFSAKSAPIPSSSLAMFLSVQSLASREHFTANCRRILCHSMRHGYSPYYGSKSKQALATTIFSRIRTPQLANYDRRLGTRTAPPDGLGEYEHAARP